MITIKGYPGGMDLATGRSADMADGRPKGVPDDAVQVPNDAVLFGAGMGPNGTPVKKGDWHWIDPQTGLIQTTGSGDDDPLQAPSDADKDSRGKATSQDAPAGGGGNLVSTGKDSKK